MKLRHVLIPTDFSEDARRPFEWARELGARVSLLHVVEDLRVVPSGAPLAPPVSVPGIEEEVKAAEQRLASLREEFGGQEVSGAVVRGEDVARAIVEHAAASGADVIALSTHGRTGFRRLILGSVAEAVLRHSTVPVMAFPRSGE